MIYNKKIIFISYSLWSIISVLFFVYEVPFLNMSNSIFNAIAFILNLFTGICIGIIVTYVKNKIFLKTWKAAKNMIYTVMTLGFIWQSICMLSMDNSYYKLTSLTAISFLCIGIITIINLNFFRKISVLIKYKKYILYIAILYLIMLPFTALIMYVASKGLTVQVENRDPNTPTRAQTLRLN